MRSLEEFEGPILSEYRAAEGGAIYVEKWCTRDDLFDRYLLVRSEQRPLAEYLGGRLSMRDLFLEYSDGAGFIVDRRRRTMEVARVYPVFLPEVPGYLPKSTAKHDESLRPAWDVVPQSYLFEEKWDAALLRDIERNYQSAVAFGFFFSSDADADPWLSKHLLAYNLKGGIPYANGFKGLRTRLPVEMRPTSRSVSANSPGVLTLDVPADVVAKIGTLLRVLPDAEPAYEAVRAWAKQKHANAEIPEAARETVERLCRYLDVDVKRLLPPIAEVWIKMEDGQQMQLSDSTDPELRRLQQRAAVLNAGKWIASYYRMLWRVAEPRSDVELLGLPDELSEAPSIVAEDADEEDEDLDFF